MKWEKLSSCIFTWILEFVLCLLRLMNYWNSYWIQPYFFHFNLTILCAHYVPIIRWKTILPLELRKISTWYLWPRFNSVGTPYKRLMSLQKRKIKRKRTMCFTCLETRGRSEGYMAKVFKRGCPKPLLVGSLRPQCLL